MMKNAPCFVYLNKGCFLQATVTEFLTYKLKKYDVILRCIDHTNSCGQILSLFINTVGLHQASDY